MSLDNIDFHKLLASGKRGKDTYTHVELKNIARELGIRVSGTKSDLVERIHEALGGDNKPKEEIDRSARRFYDAVNRGLISNNDDGELVEFGVEGFDIESDNESIDDSDDDSSSEYEDMDSDESLTEEDSDSSSDSD